LSLHDALPISAGGLSFWESTVQIDTRSGRFQVSNPGGNVNRNGIIEPSPFSNATARRPQQNAVSTGVSTTNGLTDGVIELGGDGDSGPGGLTANSQLLLPYGTGVSTNTFTLKAYAWRRSAGAGSNIASG